MFKSIKSAEEIAKENYEIEYSRVERLRQEAYQETADPLFFKYQAGEASKEEWQAARQKIKESFTYPENLGH